MITMIVKVVLSATVTIVMGAAVPVVVVEAQYCGEAVTW